MVDLVVPAPVPSLSVAPPSTPAATAASDRSVDAYLGAGDGMARIMGITLYVGLALMVLVAVGWALGVLPGAVKLF